MLFSHSLGLLTGVTWLPMAVFAAAATLSGLLTLLLPETLGQPLPGWAIRIFCSFFFPIKYISRYFTRGWTHGETAAGASHKLRAGRLMDQFCPWTDELINIYFLHTLQYWLNSLIAKKQWSQQGVDCSAQMGSSSSCDALVYYPEFQTVGRGSLQINKRMIGQWYVVVCLNLTFN